MQVSNIHGKNALHSLFLVMGSTGLKALVDLPKGVKFWAGNNTSISYECALLKIQDEFYCRAGGEVVIAPGDTLGYFLQLEEGRWASKYISFMDNWITNFLQFNAEQSIFEAWWSIHRHIDGRGDEIGDVLR